MEKEQLVSLVTKAQEGDNEALNCLFNEFYNDLYYFALKTVKDDETALDVTQEAFVEIINTLGNLKEPAAFVTWAKQITYHQCTRYFKKKKDVLVDEDEEGNTVFDTLKEEKAEFIPDEALDKADLKKTVMGILDELSEEQRSAVMMYYFDEMSVKQIAEIQGVSEGTVKSRLNYARKAIKNSVEEYEKKHNIKLHAIPFFPFLKWIFDGMFEGSLPTASAEIIAEGVATATGTTVTVATATATATTVATTTTAGAVGIGAKIAAMPIVTKVIAGVVAAAIVIGGGTTAVLLSQNDNSSNSNIIDMYEYSQTGNVEFNNVEDAFLSYFSRMSGNFHLPYFNSVEEISADVAVRFLYSYWGGYEPDGSPSLSLLANGLNSYCQEVFGKMFDFNTLTGEYARYNSKTNEVTVTFDGPKAIKDTSITEITVPFQNADGSYSATCFIYNSEKEINPNHCGTLTVKQVNNNWVIVSYTNDKLLLPIAELGVAKFNTPEEAFQAYISQIAPDYKIPYFNNTSELSEDDVVRLSYFCWGGYIEDTVTVRTIPAHSLNSIAREIFGNEYDFTKLTGKYANCNSDTGEIEINYNPFAENLETLTDMKTPVKNDDGSYSATYYVGKQLDPNETGFDINQSVYVEKYDCYITNDYYGTITLKQEYGSWKIISHTKEIKK